MIRLRRAGREHAIKEAIARLDARGRYKMHTKGEICRAMGIKSTSRVRDILNKMASCGEIIGSSAALDGYNHEVAVYGLVKMYQQESPISYGTYINGVWVDMNGAVLDGN